MSYVAEPLGEQHDLADFESGNAALDEWLRKNAVTATGQGTRTYVVVDGSGSVVGYFSIAPHTIDREELSRAQGRGTPRQIPAILLAKLALERGLHGQGLGGELLVTALGTIVDAARRAGGKFVVVDAIDDRARAFYEHFEFQPIPAEPHRLIRKLSTIARALGKEWP